MPLDRVAIVGVGLIGGSIGLALRERRLAAEVVGVGRRLDSLQKAHDRGAVNWTTTNLVEGVADADWVVVCTPVNLIADTVAAVAAVAPRATITDVGSTKAEICRELHRLRAAEHTVPERSPPADAEGPAETPEHEAAGALARQRFVGSHPLAGDHRTGPEFARADLLEGRVVVVTPEDSTPVGLVERVQGFWESLGAQVELLSPEEHDRALAATSHLPHLIAAALAASTPEEWLRLAARGWGDTTRIAAADPQLWTQIFLQNRAAVLDALRRFEHRLAQFDEAVAGGDPLALASALQEAKRIRDALGD
ncbi:MAG: prephenate dehydrogenase/arogenate dehydrogenase family protein [Planctomycetota bacterium]|nr:MAG: prephenate dehydrogenase/arogenate dehydrogenase family protein [Planctomycetota bacterium]